MRLIPIRILLGVTLSIAGSGIAVAQGAPSLQEVEAIWTALLDRLAVGDLQGAAAHVQARRVPHLLPAPPLSARDRRKLQHLVDEYAFCKIDAASVIEINPGEFYYPLKCRRGNETAERYLAVRRDQDGAWRISGF
jgi:hypothetical protein